MAVLMRLDRDARRLLALGGIGLLCGVLAGVALAPGAPRREARSEAPGATVASGQRQVTPAAPAAAPGPEPAARPGAPAGDIELEPDDATPSGPDPLDPLLERLEAAHARIHGTAPASQGKTKGLPEALTRALGTDFHPKLRKALHQKLGAGALVQGGRLTPAGSAVMARVRTLNRHAVDAKPYGTGPLESQVAAYLEASKGATVATPEAAGPGGGALVAVLGMQPFQREAAREQLRAAGVAGAADTAVAAAEAAVVAARSSDAVRQQGLALEAALGRALLRLVLDFRFINRTGPFGVTKKVDDLIADGATRRRITRMFLAVARAPSEAAALGALDPPHPSYEPLLRAYVTYLGLPRGKCPTLPEGWRLGPGSRGGPVKTLQQRLACEGLYDGPLDGVYGEAVKAAVADYQAHHELEPAGLVGARTVRSLNVPPARRRAQIALALQRVRESRINQLGDFYLRVNLPLFELQAVDRGKVVRRHRVIVGTNRLDDDKVALLQGHINRTKLFQTQLYRLIINPAWILPERVEKGEVKGKLSEDPDYLKKHNIREYTLENGRKVLVQGKGRGNVLGKVKFLLKKSNAIYLHDTDKKWLFNKGRRDFSHGCMRVQGAVEFGRWLLARDGVPAAEIDKGFSLTDTQRGFDLRHPVDFITEYMTVDAAEDGKPVFLTDIYGYDDDFEHGRLPPRERIRWGHSRLRPNWVPQVSWDTVKAWRAAGKHAPRDYDPKKHGK